MDNPVDDRGYLIDHRYDTERNMHWYHIGCSARPVYKTFYGWQRAVSLHYGYDDMPHDYFVLLNEADRLDMHRLFADHISPQVEKKIWLEDFHDFTAPVDVTSPSYLLWASLNEAITDEINAEIITQLRNL